MSADDQVNILLVDDQPAKLLSYEAILSDLGENLIKAKSGNEALESLLKSDIAVVLMDVCMPELDGFQLAAMIREHPRFQQTAIIFISAIHLTDMDRLRGYAMGAVDYVPVPVIPEVLRAKVKVFAELYRKNRQLEKLNQELERRVAERTFELEFSTARLLESERRRNLALAAGQMGSWDWDMLKGDCVWDAGQCRIFGVDAERFKVTPESVRELIHPDDWHRVIRMLRHTVKKAKGQQTEFRILHSSGEVRWCLGTAAVSLDAEQQVVRLSGVTMDITERKEAEERQLLLSREVDHRARNALAVMHSIVRLTRSDSIEHYVASVEGRIKALSRAHTLLSESRWDGADLVRLVDEELAPYRTSSDRITTGGPRLSLEPSTAQTLALALHELATNAAKYGALSSTSGMVEVVWHVNSKQLQLEWIERGGPPTKDPVTGGFGTRVIKASVEDQLGGQAVFDWREAGLRCTLSVPHQGRASSGHDVRAKHRNGAKDKASELTNLAGNRILLVEDESLVGMMMSEMLTELGLRVVGPFSRTNDAMIALGRDAVDAAILDVNLGGDPVYPVADALADRGVPFVFVTGYGSESIDRRFSHVPILQKPIERELLRSMFGATDATPEQYGRARTSAARRAAAVRH